MRFKEALLIPALLGGLSAGGCSSSQNTAQYHARFSINGIKYLTENRVPAEIANAYNERFDCYDIIHLYVNTISPSTANEYEEIFFASDIIGLQQRGISAHQTREYHTDSSFRIMEFIREGITPDVANTYDPERYELFVTDLHRAGIDAGLADSYDPQFSPSGIITLHKHNISPQTSNKFAELNRQYETNISADDIIQFSINGTAFDEIEERAKAFFIENRLSR